jgi:hypothetical protein
MNKTADKLHACMHTVGFQTRGDFISKEEEEKPVFQVVPRACMISG